MKKAGLVFFVLLLSGIGYFLTQLAPIIAGFGAKAMCSCVYVGERSEQNVLNEELSRFPLSLGSASINPADSSATGTVWGVVNAKAIYRKGWGCTLVRGNSEEQIREDGKKLSVVKPVLSDTVLWPNGSMVDFQQNPTLEKAIDWAFQEPDPEALKNTRAVLVVQDGKIIAERYADGYHTTSKHIGWSISKSITATLIGILVHQNKMDIYELAPIPQWADENDPRHAITTDHLLRMSSGLYWEEDYTKSSPVTKMLYEKASMGEYSANQELEKEPDTEWKYSSGTSNIISYQIRVLLGDDAYYQFPYETLFTPLGIRTALFEADASGTYSGSSYMWASARDWARLGQFLINDGVWNGERLLPEGWVDYVSTPTAGADKGQYGAHFWLNAGDKDDPKNRRMPDVGTDVFMMNGYDGQRIYMVPSKNAVVVRMGKSKKGDFDFNAFLSGVIAVL